LTVAQVICRGREELAWDSRTGKPAHEPVAVSAPERASSSEIVGVPSSSVIVPTALPSARSAVVEA